MSELQGRKEPIPPTSHGRRRFLGAGTSAAPALITLVSTPALGVTCFTPSRNLSQNTSLSQQAYIGQCTGATVTSYRAGTGWPVPTSTAFHPLFAGDNFYVKATTNGSQARSCTLLEVMQLDMTTLAPPAGTVWCTSTGQARATPKPLAAGSTTPEATTTVAKHVIAAYLNCTRLLVPANVLQAAGTHPSCTLMWSDFKADGTYEVMASVLWGPTQIVDYLISNGIAPA